MANDVNHSGKDFPKPIVFAGPSGSGKSTLIKKLKEEYGDFMGFSVSHTTRKPRPGEKDGVDYHYSNLEDMKKAVANGEFIETATFSGNMYGTSKKAVQDVVQQYKVCILDIDMQGVTSVRNTSLNPIYVFVKPPSMTVLEERLRGRKTESEEAIQKRLQTADREMKFIEKEGSNGSHVIVNDDIDQAYKSLLAIAEVENQFVKAKNHKLKNGKSDEFFNGNS